MTRLQKQLIETYEASGYSAVLDFWKKNEDSIKHLSQNEISILKNTMSRYCMIHNDEKVPEIISLEDKQQFLHNNAIMELLFKFGKYYYDGVNLNPSFVQSEEIYEMILELGNSNDLYRLGDNYYSGNSINQSYEKAFECFQKSAMKGNKLAQYRLGEMYMQGKGVTKSKEEAIKWYKTSNAASNSYDLSTMIIPEGITCIEESAFEGFENIVEVIIPKSVQGIRDYAFKGCVNLKNILVNNKKITFGVDVYENCISLSKEVIDFHKKNSMDYVLVKGNKEINDFYVVRNAVTQELYQKIMGINPSVYKENMKPVVNVSWYDTIYFCNKLSINSGLRPVYYVSGTSDVETWEYKPHQGECLMGDINQDISANGFRLLSLDEWYWFYARNSSKKTDFKILNNPDNYDENNMRGSVWEWVWGDYSSGRTYKYCCSGSYVMSYKDKIYKAKEQSDSIGIRIGRSVFN